ncbi:MAG TPA: polysaccharide biosynthesis C-terminal domain-containing protein, partial [Ignavibacteriaceae bacterium]|nr:polysaccharide biosynthesis C-terminal domain-containing protein [Ignavibacteriaceae bacterium]
YFKNFRIKFNPVLFKRLLKFGLPYLPGGMSAIFLHVIDRPIVEHLTDLKTLGIYQANYRLGIFMMLFVMMFQYAWQPFFLQNAKEGNAKEIFSKVFTYFTIIGGIILVAISLFIDDLVKIQIMNRSFIGEAYWGGLSIVPIILLAYLFNGFHYIFSAGLFIKEKSNSVPLIMGIAAGVNVAVNFALIPTMHIFGAALATLASYFVLAAGFFIVSQRLYEIKYEYTKMFRLFLILTGSGFVYYYMISTPGLGILFKVLFFLLFVLALLILKVIEKKEFLFMKELLLKRIKG